MVEFVTICRNDYIVLLACSSLVTICGIIPYFIIRLAYAFFVAMAVFLMEDHPTNAKVCLSMQIIDVAVTCVNSTTTQLAQKSW